MPKQTDQEKYCKYMQQNVVVSDYNNRGKCTCLKCNQSECTKECSANVHSVRISRKCSSGRVCWIRGNCNECINTTLYSNQR
ncbi:MAG: hypothetical protein IKP24_01080 [Alphaproteobacteria bacterium]|nr:hypothetical protein [Alphaproteobacteria bacterium]